MIQIQSRVYLSFKKPTEFKLEQYSRVLFKDKRKNASFTINAPTILRYGDSYEELNPCGVNIYYKNTQNFDTFIFADSLSLSATREALWNSFSFMRDEQLIDEIAESDIINGQSPCFPQYVLTNERKSSTSNT